MMEGKTYLLLLVTVVQVIHLETLVTNATSPQPTVEIVTGYSRVFIGDTVRLKCNPPATPYNSTWIYTWHRGNQQLPHFDEILILADIKTKHSGKYYCRVSRETSVIDIPTVQSEPAEISVVGGWAILEAPSQGVVGFPLNMMCRVKTKRPLTELALYRNGEEVVKGQHPVLILHNVTLPDNGMYTCRASWIQSQQTRSVISSPVAVRVVEALTKPILIIEDNEKLRSLSMLQLRCVLEYNVPEPAPPLLYYFYLSNNRLVPPSSESVSVIRRSKGPFTCQAKVPKLGLSLWSEPESL